MCMYACYTIWEYYSPSSHVSMPNQLSVWAWTDSKIVGYCVSLFFLPRCLLLMMKTYNWNTKNPMENTGFRQGLDYLISF